MNSTMKSIRKSHIHTNVEKAVAEAIRRELRDHKDIARLVLWASDLQRQVIVNKSGVLCPWLKDRAITAAIIGSDLKGAAKLVEHGNISLRDKVTITKGSTVLLYAQSTILLRDVHAACKTLVVMPSVKPKRASIPRSKTNSRHIATTFKVDASPWRQHVESLSLKDKKYRLENFDNRIMTPSAYDGFAHNKIIMGVGIYSQFEFDEDNNVCNQRTHVIQWSKPSAPSPLTSDIYRVKTGICNGTPKREFMQGYLDDLNDMDNIDPTPRFYQTKKNVLEKYDDIVTADNNALYEVMQLKNHKTKRDLLLEDTLRYKSGFRLACDTMLTINDIRECFYKELETQMNVILPSTVKTKRKRRRVSVRPVNDSENRNPVRFNKKHALRTNSGSTVTNVAHEYRSLIKKHFEKCRGNSYNLIEMMSVGAWVSRREASAIFMVLLELACEGKVILTQNGSDITVGRSA